MSGSLVILLLMGDEPLFRLACGIGWVRLAFGIGVIWVVVVAPFARVWHGCGLGIGGWVGSGAASAFVCGLRNCFAFALR